MVGSEVLIILRVQEQNRLIPVRWATIIETDQIGSIYFFQYILGDLVSYSSDRAERDRQIAHATEIFAESHVWLPGTAGEMLFQPSVFRSTVGFKLERVAAADYDTAWGNSVDAITIAPVYQNMEFLQILGFFDLKGKSSTIYGEHYVLSPNTVYQLKVFQYIPTVPGQTSNVAPHNITVATFADHFVQLRTKQRAVGLYDELIFMLKTKRLPPKEPSAMELTHDPTPDSTGLYAPGTLYIPVITTGRSPALTVFWAIVLVACLVGMFTPQAYHTNETVIRNLATVIFVLIVSGWRMALDAIFPPLPWQANK